jgi:hypothetical protein
MSRHGRDAAVARKLRLTTADVSAAPRKDAAQTDDDGNADPGHTLSLGAPFG